MEPVLKFTEDGNINGFTNWSREETSISDNPKHEFTLNDLRRLNESNNTNLNENQEIIDIFNANGFVLPTNLPEEHIINYMKECNTKLLNEQNFMIKKQEIECEYKQKMQELYNTRDESRNSLIEKLIDLAISVFTGKPPNNKNNDFPPSY